MLGIEECSIFSKMVRPKYEIFKIESLEMSLFESEDKIVRTET